MPLQQSLSTVQFLLSLRQSWQRFAMQDWPVQHGPTFLEQKPPLVMQVLSTV